MEMEIVQQLYILLCRNAINLTSDVVWKPDEDIDQIINSNYMNIATVSAYFDFVDYDTPIKTYMNDLDVLTLSTTFDNYYDLRIKQNKAIIIDDIIATNSYESITYYSTNIPNYRTVNKEASENLLRAFVVLSRESEQYERVVYSFFDMFGYLGGLFDFLYFVGFIWVEWFNEKYYNLRILTKLYQVEQSTMSPMTKLFNEKSDVSIMPKMSNASFTRLK